MTKDEMEKIVRDALAECEEALRQCPQVLHPQILASKTSLSLKLSDIENYEKISDLKKERLVLFCEAVVRAKNDSLPQNA